jgi:hypothetical protein
MSNAKDPKTMAKYIISLSMLEDKSALLYKRLSDDAENPFAKSILLSISQDSSKHSALLQGIGSSISSVKISEKDCAKNLGQTWRTTVVFLDEAISSQGTKKSLEALYDKLVALESGFGEEYYVFVQMQTLEYLTKEINQLYNLSLDKVKGIFESIIKDEDHHRELLETLKEMGASKSKPHDYTPIVRFQSPDRWINYTPSN